MRPLLRLIPLVILLMANYQSFSQCSNSITSFPANDGFESGLTYFSNVTGDDFDWTVNSGTTPSANQGSSDTGPNSAVEGTYYVYTEVSGEGGNDVANLVSHCLVLPSTGSPWIAFNYHMYTTGTGNTMGSLHLDIKPNASSSSSSWSSTTLWSKSGSQGDQWYTDTIDLSAYSGTTIQLRFRGVRGTGFAANLGDRALDNITFSNGISTTPISCPGGTNGSITAIPQFGTPPYSYAWSNSATSATITGLSAGTYTVTVTDSASSTETITHVLSQPVTPTPTGLTASSNAICANETTPVTLTIDFPSEDSTFSATSGITGDTGTQNSAGGPATYNFVGLPPLATDSAMLTFYYRGDMEAAAEFVTLASETGTTIGSSSPAAGQCQSAYSNSTFMISPDSLNAWAQDGVLNITGTPTGMTRYCNAGSGNYFSWRGYYELSYPVSQSIPYWFTSSCDSVLANAVDSGYSISVLPTTTTTYYVRYYDAGCDEWSSCQSVTITVNPQPNVSISPASATYCSTPVTLTASGANTYAWSPGTGLNTTSGATVQASPANSTTYQVVGTDAVGCVDTNSVTVTVTSGFTLSTSSTSPTCSGGSDGSATVSASGGSTPYTYEWSNGATTATISNISAGTYSVTVTDASGCGEITSVTVSDPSAFTVVLGGQGPNCNSGTSGSVLSASFVNGSASYAYVWSTGANGTTNSTFQFLFSQTAGDYSITVTDGNGCIDSADITITEPDSLILDSVSGTTLLCNGDNSGTATAHVSGGTSPYNYSWSNSGTTATINGLAAGTYTVTVTDDNGCSVNLIANGDSVTLTEPAPLVLSATVDSNVSCNGGSDGGATASATGGTTAYSYAWSNSATTASITGVAAGTYTVTITDANGCTDTETVTITEPSAITVSTTSTNVSCNGGSDGTASASASGGTGTITFAWSNSATTASISGLSAGTYTVTATDANGCEETASVTITEPAALVASITTNNNVSCNGGSDGSATASAIGGTTAYSYAWSNGATSATATGLAAGTYNVTITDANGCTDSESVTITQPATLVAATSLNNNVSCNGGSDGSATASATGGTTAYSYTWSNSATTATVSNLSAGTYTVTVEDANGCTDTETITITEPAVLVASTTLDSNVSCNGGSDGGATASATGGTTAYSYAWSNSATTASITGVAAGTYTVTVTDANGCTDTETVTITAPTAITVSTTSTNVSCNGGSDGTASASASGGTGTITFAWSNSATTASISGLSAGTYTVTATDANGCEETASVTITEPAALVASITTNNNVSCNGGSDGSATASAIGGTTAYSYAWSNGATSATATGLAAGTYNVTITDANGCTDSESVTITEPATLVAATSLNNNVSCNGGSDGSATASATGGTTAYSYTWSNSATTATVSNLSAGTYTVTVEDANGCTDTETITITEPAVLVASTTLDSNVSCNGGSDGGATASATGGTTAYSYAWSNSATTASITGVAAGTYTVTVTDANGCTDTETVTITAPTAITVSTTSTNVSCNGGSDGTASASASGGTGTITFVWSNSATTASITGLSAGTYTVTATDANGCEETASVTITEPAALVASITTNNNVSCNGGSDGSATASAIGGTTAYSYAWSNGATSATATGLAAGTYNVTITDANGCTDSESVTITEPATLVAATSLNNNVSCNGGSDGSATASATGGTTAYSYTWSNSATTATVSNLSAGTYTVTVEDANGCTDTETITITEPAVLVASTTLDSNVSCNGGSDGGATASATGGTTAYSYAWSNSATTASITGVAAGTYTVTVTDNNGCEDTASVTITEPTLLVASTSLINNVSCNGGADGSASASATGGTTAYSYAWSNSATTATISGLAAGTYTVTVTDANGCEDTASITITEPGVLVASIALDNNVSCNGGSDGAATASATGGTTAYSYAWSNGATTATASGLAAATYTVTVTDANGCTDTESITITEPAVLVAAISLNNNVSCNGGTDGSATASATGGTTAYSYTWSNSATTATANNLSAGTYTVTVEDANGCTDTETITITEPTPLIAATTLDSNVSCNGGSDGGATASATGGTTAYSYAWSNSATTASITGVAAGTYTVTVTDANGCEDTASVTITEPTLLVASTSLINNVSCNGGSDGSASASATGGTTAYGYTWSNSATTATISGLAAGTYTVTVTDANGCEDTASITINEPAVLVASIALDNNVSCNGGSDGSATASATGGTTAYSYAWSNGATTATASGLAAATYTVTVTDVNGCTDTESITITEPAVLVAAISLDSNVSCNGGTDGSATASATGGTTAYSYTWSNSTTTATASGLSAGTYTVTVEDANGCTDTETITITEPTPLIAATTLDSNVSCNGGSDGGATASATGGTTAYSYAWSNSATTASITGVAAGTYTVTVTDANGCEDTASVTITEPTLLVASTSLINNVSCNGGSDGSASASATGGTTAYGYTWSNSATTATISGLAAGTYTVTVTDANGCEDTASITINEPAVLVASIALDSNVSCNGGSDGAATASATGGTTAYSYAWSNGATTATASGLAAATYTVTVTDANGCTDTESITITEPAVLVAATALNNNVSCNGGNDGTATASATGGTTVYGYTWSNGDTTATADSLTAGSYTVTVTDANGCTDTSTITITEPPVLAIAMVLDSNVSCFQGNDGGATVVVTGGTPAYNYNWNLGDTTANISNVVAGTYFVTVTDSLGCSAMGSITISQPTQLSISASLNNNVSCYGGSDGSVSASATGGTSGYSYAWSNGATTATVNGLAAGTYIVTGTDANGCEDTAFVVVSEPDTLNLSFSIDTVDCNGGSDGQIVAAVTGGTSPYSYLWSNGATSDTNSNLIAGTYSVTITDANGCSGNWSTQLTEPDSLIASILLTDSVLCNGDTNGMAVAGAVGGTLPYAFAWPSAYSASNDTLLAAPAGSFMVTVTDANGCEDSTVATIYEPSPLALSIDSLVDVTCVGGVDGYAMIAASGANGGYAYLWADGDTTAFNDDLSAGTHCVTVVDANGCSDTICVTIGETYALPTVDLGPDTALCDSTYSLTAPLATTYLWSNGATTQSISINTGGIYGVTIGDTNGCANSDQVAVLFSPQLNYEISTDSAACGASDGMASITNLSGSGNYSIAWSTSQAGGLNHTGLSAGTYTVTVSDQNGCDLAQSFTIHGEGVFDATITSLDPHCAGGNDGWAMITTTGAAAPVTHLWSTGSTSDSATALSAGTYMVTSTDVNGCTRTDTVSLVDPQQITISTAVIGSTCGDTNGLAVVTDVQPAGTYSFLWNDALNQTTDTASNLTPGVYTVTTTNAFGCEATASVLIDDQDGPVLITTSIANTCSSDTSGVAIVQATGAGPFTFLWNDSAAQSTDTANNLVSGTYYVTVQDTNGCTSIDSTTVGYIAVSPVVNLGADTNLCATSYTISGPAGNYTYLWSTGDTTMQTTITSGALVSLQVTDTANGCSGTDEVLIQLNTPIALSDTSSDASCGINNGAASVQVLAGNGGYNFAWSTGDTTDSITGVAGGWYTVTVTDSLGCSSEDTVEVGVADAPMITMNVTNALCGNSDDGMVSATVVGGVAPYSFSWSNGSNDSSAAGLTAGLYVLTLTDDSGCVIIDSAEVSAPPVMQVDFVASMPNCGDSNGSIWAMVINNQGGAAFSWNDVNATDSAYVDGLYAGTWEVTITDSVGCEVVHDYVLNDNGAPFLALGSVDNQCDNGNAGVAFVLAAGAGPFTYTWSDAFAQTTDTAVALGSGDYSVSVVDTNGCTSIGNVTVGSFYDAPVVDLGPDVEACAGDEVILTPGGGFTSYFWTTGATTPSVLATLSQPYEVQVLDINGCSGSDTVTVQFFAPPTPMLGNDTLVCIDKDGSEITLDAGTGYNSYLWNTGDTTQQVTVQQGGVYSVTVSEIAACSGSDQIIVVFDTCINVGDDELVPTASASMQLYPNPNLGEFTVATDGLVPGTYLFKVIGMNGELAIYRDVELNATNNAIKVDLRTQAKGIYFVELIGNEQQLQARVVIQ